MSVTEPQEDASCLGGCDHSVRDAGAPATWEAVHRESGGTRFRSEPS